MSIFRMNFTKVIFLATPISTTLPIAFTPVTGTTIFADDFGKAGLYHEVWHIYIAIDTDNIVTRQQQIWDICYILLHHTYASSV